MKEVGEQFEAKVMNEGEQRKEMKENSNSGRIQKRIQPPLEVNCGRDNNTQGDNAKQECFVVFKSLCVIPILVITEVYQLNKYFPPL